MTGLPFQEPRFPKHSLLGRQHCFSFEKEPLGGQVRKERPEVGNMKRG